MTLNLPTQTAPKTNPVKRPGCGVFGSRGQTAALYAIGSGTYSGALSWANLGLVRIIEGQVEKLRAHPDWTQVIAEEFKVIPPQPGNVDLSTLDPNARAKVIGEGMVRLTWRSSVGIAEVHGVSIEADRGDGEWHQLTYVPMGGSFIDNHLPPQKSCVWRYRIRYRNRYGAFFGVASIAAVAVAPVAA